MSTVMTSDGVRLHAESTGSGPAILFIHEYAADHRGWELQVATLCGEFRCITYASRGYPPSEVPPEQDRYSYIRQADDAIDVLDAFGIEKAHVVGLSMGGYCALQLGIRYQERVLSLFVSSTGSGAIPGTRAAFLAATERMARDFRREGSAAVAEVLAVGPTRIQLRRKNYHAWRDFADRLAGHSAEGMALTALGIHLPRPPLYEIASELRSISAPTRIVCGDEDGDCLEPGLLLKRTIPGSGLLVVPNSGHTLNLEEPELYNRAIQGFVHRVQRG